MHFTKPAWVMHKDSSKNEPNPKRLSIFSVHVHPDGSRIATGGLDAKIRIWSTKPILNPASELSNKPPKSLCTLTMHTGPVLVVRWAHSGRWLASGSDDEIVMIWDLDPHAKGRVWGSDEVNVEGWKPLKRLPGHESDVVDVAWSPGDRYLASVGLDSKVMIWCGYTLERLRKLDEHQGFVKGVCWDPVGEFLATQSDDRTVKIWNTTDWSLRAEVSKPFAESPGSTFFRRLSWSPDGAHITASNATNNKGFVFIAAVITRNTWSSEISLVGHENTVEVASYNPHIFLRNPEDGVHTNNICSVVALGADDRSVSIWQTKAPRPLIVAKEVFERQIMDLSWSSDGMTLYAASSDGTIAAFNFEPDELEGIAPQSAQEEYLRKFGFQMPEVPAGYSHTVTPETVQNGVSQPQPSGFAQPNGNGERVNVLVAKRGKKRANLNSIPSAGIPSASAPLPPRSAQQYQGNDASISARRPTNSYRFPSPSEQPFAAVDAWSRHADTGMDLDLPTHAIDTGSKRKASNMMDFSEDGRPTTKARTLGGDRKRDYVPVKTIELQAGPSNLSAGWQGAPNGPTLSIPPVLNALNAEVEDSDDVLEGRNYENGEPTEVFFTSGKQTQWLDYLPSPVILVRASSSFCAAATLDGTLHVYSATGRRLMPPLALGVPCSFMEVNKHALVVLTSRGLLYSWNTKEKNAFFPPISIGTLLSSPNQTITAAAVRPNGVPIITCSDEVVYSYDPSLSTWVKVTEKWWMEGSDAWSGRQRANVSNTNRGIMSSIEASISSTPDDNVVNKSRPEWWDAALTLGHLETRLHSTRLLDSPQEYKQALLLYAKKISDEGFRGKAEELIKELFGPVFCRPGREGTWTPTIVGLSKRDLLKDVLSVFVRSKTLTKLAMDWQDTLKKATSDD